MKICVVSDIHMEIGGFPGKTKYLDGDVLVIAGDLTKSIYFYEKANEYPNLKKGMLDIKKLERYWFPKFKKIYYVMGNHEHYGNVFKYSANMIEKYFEGTNVKILDNSSELYEGILFIGSTLWTDFDKKNICKMQDAETFMRDYEYITRVPLRELTYVERNHPKPHIKYGMMTADFIYDEHIRSVGTIRQLLENNKEVPTVVITHHAPSLRCQNVQRHGTNMIHAYCSDLEPLIEENSQIKLWISGHTHDNHDFMVGETRLLSNQHGYINYENQARYFRPKTVEI